MREPISTGSAPRENLLKELWELPAGCRAHGAGVSGLLGPKKSWEVVLLLWKKRGSAGGPGGPGWASL